MKYELDVVDAIWFEGIFGCPPYVFNGNLIEAGREFLEKFGYYSLFDYKKEFAFSRSPGGKNVMVFYDGREFHLIVKAFAIKIFSGRGRNLMDLMMNAFAEIKKMNELKNDNGRGF